MPLNLLVANTAVLLCLVFLLPVDFNKFFIILLDIKNARLKLALAIATSAPTIVANDLTEMLPNVTNVADKIFKHLSK